MKRMRSQSGQMTLEAILIATVLVAVALSVSRYIQNNGLLADLIEAPWQPIQGMIENGVWESGAKARAHHPSQLQRHSSNSGQDISGT